MTGFVSWNDGFLMAGEDSHFSLNLCFQGLHIHIPPASCACQGGPLQADHAPGLWSSNCHVHHLSTVRWSILGCVSSVLSACWTLMSSWSQWHYGFIFASQKLSDLSCEHCECMNSLRSKADLNPTEFNPFSLSFMVSFFMLWVWFVLAVFPRQRLPGPSGNHATWIWWDRGTNPTDASCCLRVHSLLVTPSFLV